MRFAVSNIGLRPNDHLGDLRFLYEMGFEGLEVALSRVFLGDWNNPSAHEVEAYRHGVETMGLSIIGLHSLFWERPEFSMFGDRDVISKTLDFLVQLSAVCRDLGGKTLIFGSRTARTKGKRTKHEANVESAEFFDALCNRIENHGTCFCIEPLEIEVADYVHSVLDSQAIVQAVNHPALQVQIDIKAMALANEVKIETFEAVSENLVHVHANEPGFNILGTSGLVDHAKIGAFLKDISYDGYISIEQRMIDNEDPLAGIRESVKVLNKYYV